MTLSLMNCSLYPYVGLRNFKSLYVRIRKLSSGIDYFQMLGCQSKIVGKPKWALKVGLSCLHPVFDSSSSELARIYQDL